jgi:hypothetical protein
MLDSIEAVITVSPLMQIRTGPPPPTCGDADSGVVLATLVLPADWMLPAGSGSKGKSGTWSDASADADGAAGHFRVYNSAGSICHIQGTVTITGAGGDMTVDNPVFATGQTFIVTAFTFNAGNG